MRPSRHSRQCGATLQEFSSLHVELSVFEKLAKFCCRIVQPGVSASSRSDRVFITSGRVQSTIAFGDQARFQAPIQHDGRWQRVNIPRLGDRAVAIEQNRKRQGLACEEAAHRAVGLGNADRNDRERPVASSRDCIWLEARHFCPTGLAPGGEEMDENDPTAKPRKLVGRAVEAWAARTRIEGKSARAASVVLPVGLPSSALPNAPVMHRPTRRDARTSQPRNAVSRHRERQPLAAISSITVSRIVVRDHRPLLRPRTSMSIPLGVLIADVISREFLA